MRIVLDTNILARANPHSKGVARTRLLTILESADHVLVLSPFLLRETERVLNYPRLQAIWPLTRPDIEQYTQALQDFAELVNPQSGARLVRVGNGVVWTSGCPVYVRPAFPSHRGSPDV